MELSVSEVRLACKLLLQRELLIIFKEPLKFVYYKIALSVHTYPLGETIQTAEDDN